MQVYIFLQERQWGEEKREKREEKPYTRENRQARVDSLIEITYDRMKTESQD